MGKNLIKFQVFEARVIWEKNVYADPIKLDDPVQVYKYFSYLVNKPEEHFLVAYVNSKLKTIGVLSLFRGTNDTSFVMPKEVIKYALILNCSRFILIHNHPSGDADPSSADIDITRQISNMAKVFDMDVVDHVIIGDGEIYSYASGEKVKVRRPRKEK